LRRRACPRLHHDLIVITEDREILRPGRNHRRLMPEHPARTIVIRLPARANVHRAARLRQCWMPFGQRRQICCEQWKSPFDASLGDLPSVVLPLEVPDLPVILWCRSPRLLGMADFPPWRHARRVVVDSSA